MIPVATSSPSSWCVSDRERRLGWWHSATMRVLIIAVWAPGCARPPRGRYRGDWHVRRAGTWVESGVSVAARRPEDAAAFGGEPALAAWRRWRARPAHPTGDFPPVIG